MPPNPGEVYRDDATIADGELLYRMVTAANTKFEDGIAVRAGTNAFQDQDRCVASDRASSGGRSQAIQNTEWSLPSAARRRPGARANALQP